MLAENGVDVYGRGIATNNRDIVEDSEILGPDGLERSINRL